MCVLVECVRGCLCESVDLVLWVDGVSTCTCVWFACVCFQLCLSLLCELNVLPFLFSVLHSLVAIQTYVPVVRLFCETKSREW